MTNSKAKKEVKEEIKKEEEDEEEEERQEQDGVSVHSPCKINSSSLRKEKSEVELELRLLEALEIYPPSKLRGVHRHFVLYGLTEYMRKSKPDDEDAEFLNHEEDFRLPQSYFAEEESKKLDAPKISKSK
ncbi:hypothetical protein OROMI_025084 [Orobanche minor]